MQATKKQLVRFLVVGASSTALNYLVFFILFSFLEFSYLLASALGFIAGVLLGYSLNKFWTFAVKEHCIKEFLKYLGVYGFSLLLSLVVLAFLVENLSLDARLANIMVIMITTVVNFSGVKLLVFKR